MRIEENTLTAEQFILLFESVGWKSPAPPQVEKALKNSVVVFSAVENERVIGMARLIGDRSMSYYIKDLAILPAEQGKGIGKALIEQIERFILAETPKGEAVSLELISSKGKELFYEKFGFEQRPCEYDGAGMMKMLRAK